MDLNVYSCTTSHRCRHFLRAALALFVMLCGVTGSRAANTLTDQQAQHIDSIIHVGLITCQPSPDEVYSLYGHTAIHFVNTELGVDVAANWGVFSLAQKGFAFRFLMGTALYALDIQPYDSFCQYYAMHRRGIVEQPLNLSAEEKLRFAQALAENSMPQNRDYRYDFFYDNCSTRARDIIIRSLDSDVSYADDDPDERPSFRYLTHQYNADHPWARFGNDILLGLKADSPISQEDAQFLPDRLMADFAKAAKADTVGGQHKPLVGETRVIVPYFSNTSAEDFPLRPRDCFLLLLGLVIVVTGFELRMKRHLWLFDTILMLTAGICGVVLFAMIFSKHPTVSLNLQLLLLNPLPLMLVWRMVSRSRKHLPDRQYLLWLLLICLFFVGNLWQTYAEGMNLVGAALLVRNVRLWMRQRTFANISRRGPTLRRATVLACVLVAVGEARADEADNSWLQVNEIQVSNLDMFLNPQYNFGGWVELYNPTGKAISLGGLYFSDDETQLKKWHSPADMGTVEPDGHFVLWFEDQNITDRLPDYKLDAGGGMLFVSDGDGKELLRFAYPKAFPRTSYARTADGAGDWSVCTTPTPGHTNSGSIFVEARQVELPVVDKPSQVFTSPIDVHVDFPAGSTLRYTTDGSVPTLENGATSTDGNFHITRTSCFRWRTFQEGCVSSNIASRTFLWSEMPIGDSDAQMTVGHLSLPILSVVSDNRFFFDPMIGVMVKGENGIEGNGVDEPCNWNQEWPRAVSFAYFNDGEKPDFNDDAIFEISGAWSRRHHPHPFKLKANKVFGHGKTLDYPFFDEKPFIRNRTLQMRNGVDTDEGRPAERFKDSFLSYIIHYSGIDVEMQGYQPVAHFVNGQYQGVIDMREPNNKHYVFANHGWDEEEIDMFEAEEPDTLIVTQGDRVAFDRLYHLSFSAADEQSYALIRQLLDVDEYINYMALELYIGNNDWIRNNMKWFRHHYGGPFRIVLFDLDAAFNKYGMVSDWLSENFAGWQMTTLFFNLLENDSFRRQFIDTYCLMGGSVFRPELTKRLTGEARDRIENDLRAQGESAQFMVDYIDKWLVPYSNSYANFLKKFGLARLQDAEAYRLHIYSNDEGMVLMNGLVVPHGEYHGWFFSPMTVEAIAPAGMRFAGWKDPQTGSTVTEGPRYEVPEAYTTLAPVFVALDDTERKAAGVYGVMINEVSAANNSYVNDLFKRSDWIELYNTTDSDVDLKGMYLSNDSTNRHLFVFGQEVSIADASYILPARGHRVVWCDGVGGRSQLHAPFKLSKSGGYVCLTAADDSWTQTFAYTAHDDQTTIGRYPDGCKDIYRMNVPTIGKPNIRTSYLSAQEATSINGIEVFDKETTIKLRYVGNSLVVEHAAHPAATADVCFYNEAGLLIHTETAVLHGGKAIVPLTCLARGCYIAIASVKGAPSATCHFCL